jgi:aspartate kinase
MAEPAKASEEDDGRRTTPLVVQKFGGTSLGTPEKLEKVLNIVTRWHEQGGVACVVSALSSHTKSEGTTSRLLMAAESAVAEEPFHHYLDAIEDTHLDVVYSMLRKHENRETVKTHVARELRIVRRFCESLTVIRELSPRSHDMIIGCGERLSAGLIAGVLREHSIPAVYVNLSNLFRSPLETDKTGYHIKATAAIRSLLEREVDVDGVVPVITGYLGEISGGIINGIGRGYSDLTAALVAAALRADSMQVSVWMGEGGNRVVRNAWHPFQKRLN